MTASSPMLWIGIALTAALCYGLKYAGLAVPQRVLDHPWTVRVADLIPVGLLGALVAVQLLQSPSGGALVLDARVLGVAVAVVLLLLRAPFLAVVGAAALVAALARLL
ncbi:MAG: AzlD domain-containing protein [Nocardioidaceae bacterium]|nr:AzlD domain-containing protein [Nocardioidaceae bacterium]